MLFSRFSKLPGVQSLMPSEEYKQESIDKAVIQMKELGQRTISGEHQLLDIGTILSQMKKYNRSVMIQKVGCHALSNLAMQTMASRWIIQKGGFEIIKAAIERFPSNHKLCWLASSAIWNLARPPANRDVIGTQGCDLMISILTNHKDNIKVVNTAIGALSNLSLCDQLKNYVANSKNLDLTLAVLVQHLVLRSECVLTSGAGLLANLAVSDEHATTLVRKNVLAILLELLSWNSTEDDETLHRNTCAGLNNLVTGEGYIKEMLQIKGIEQIYKFLESNENDMFKNLLDNCLVHMDTEVTSRTTSYHLASFHGELDVLRWLIQKDNSTFDLNSKDSTNRTPLDFAIQQENTEIASFLAKCGAKNHSQKEMETPMIEALKKGTETLKTTIDQNKKAIRNTLEYFPTDLCDLILSWESNVDMLKGVDQF